MQISINRKADNFYFINMGDTAYKLEMPEGYRWAKYCSDTSQVLLYKDLKDNPLIAELTKVSRND